MTETGRSSNLYRQHKTHNQTLSGLFGQLNEIAAALDNPPWKKRIDFVLSRLADQKFRVMVIGEFKRGKSTLINAMLGKKVLAAYALPCTATIHELKYGEAPKAIVYHQDPNIDPREVPVDSIRNIGVITTGREDLPCEYEKIELYWPLELLADGVEIIDSPGLNESGIRSDVTMKYLPVVDAVLFLLACDQVLSATECQTIDDVLIPMGYNDIFFVCNRINLIENNQHKDIKDYTKEKLAHRTNPNSERIFFVNAEGALNARLENDQFLFDESGVAMFEKELERFLANDKGRFKLLNISKTGKEIIRLAKRNIAENESAAETRTDVLKQKISDAKQPFEILKRKRRYINHCFEGFIDKIHLSTINLTRDFWNNTAEKLAILAQEIEIENNINIRQLEKPIEEVVMKLKPKLLHEFAEWQQQELRVMISNRFDPFRSELDSNLQEFSNLLAKMREELYGISTHEWAIENNLDMDMEDISLQIIRGFMPFPILDALKFLNPFRLIQAILDGDIIDYLKGVQKNIENEIKRAVAKELKKELKSKRKENAEKLAEHISDKIKTFQKKMDRVLIDELLDISQQLKRQTPCVRIVVTSC